MSLLTFFCYINLLGLLPISIGLSLQRSDCVKKCEHLDNEQFGICIAKCSKTPRTDNVPDGPYYPPPPHNVTISTQVEIDGGKFLVTTIRWKAVSDVERSGFYLSYTADTAECERDFPGYFVSHIPSKAREHQIPALFSDLPLVINHGCSYTLQMYSKPYRYGDEAHLVKVSHTVPLCIGSYCKCDNSLVPVVEDMKVLQTSGGLAINWQHRPSQSRSYMFYLTLMQRFHQPLKLQHPNAFKFRIVENGEYELPGPMNATSYGIQWPIDLKSNDEYRLSMFAEDDQYCHTNDTVVYFNTTADMTALPTMAAERIVTQMTPVVDTAPEPNVTYVKASVTEYDSPTVKAPTFLQHLEHLTKIDGLSLLILLLLLAIVSPLCTLTIYFCIRQRRQRRRKKLMTGGFGGAFALSRSRHSILETNILYHQPIELRTPQSEEDWLIRAEDVSLGSVIGEGAFGIICKGTMKGPRGLPIRVAIKQLKANAVDEEKEDFQRELDIMKQVGRHPNIVSMYGYCREGNIECMVMEYVPFGDLKHYLQNLRKQLSLAVSTLKTSLRLEEQLSMHGSFMHDTDTQLQYTLDPQELQSFAAQLALGMTHLESLSITHRDLAARNILVSENKQLKISDFGMSRTGVYVKMSTGVIPLRWLSPEAIKDNTYSTKSDVWAYGIVLWEIVTLGGFPYPTISDKDLLPFLLAGNRIEKPMSCSDEIYNIMSNCWKLNSKDRPTFSCICDQLGSLKCPYVDFPPNAALPPHEAFELIDSGTIITG